MITTSQPPRATTSGAWNAGRNAGIDPVAAAKLRSQRLDAMRARSRGVCGLFLARAVVCDLSRRV